MKTYLVGGAVRDTLLGLDPKDLDYVIVGATPEDVDNLVNFQGYQQVGVDFPVFLHPVTGDEYALARVERKVGVGYNGFETFTSPDLTIEDDLRRRDLTINAMAMDLESGEIIDPFGGQDDLKNGVLRHVSEAFAEDPLRVLRVARFQARYGFDIHTSTLSLMAKLVHAGELDHLTRERIWVEFEKLLNEKHSSLGIKTLFDLDAFTHLFVNKCMDGLGRYSTRVSTETKDRKIFDEMNAISKFVLFAKGANWDNKDLQDMKIPTEFKAAYLMFEDLVDDFVSFQVLEAYEYLKFVERAGLLKQGSTFDNIKDALALELFIADAEFSKGENFLLLKRVVEACKQVNCEEIASACSNGKEIAEKIKAAREKQIKTYLIGW